MFSEEEAKALVAAEPIAKHTAGPHETADSSILWIPFVYTMESVENAFPTAVYSFCLT